MPAKGQYKSNAKEASVKKRAFNAQPEQKKRRAERNASRRKMEKEGRVRKGDNRDVDHKNMNTADNSNKNLRVQPRSVNRARNTHHLKKK